MRPDREKHKIKDPTFYNPFIIAEEGLTGIWRRIVRLFSFGLSLFLIYITLISFFDVGFNQGNVLFMMYNKDTRNGFYIERGEDGIEIWRVFEGIVGYRAYP